MSGEISDAVLGHLRRARVVKVDDGGTQQLLDLRGLAADRPERVVRVLPHGFSSNPPANAEGLLLALGGRSDRLFFVGGEHQDKRPKSLPAGACALYDASGKIIKFLPDETDWDAGGKNVTIRNAAKVTIVGATEVALSANDQRFVRVRPGRIDLGVTAAGQDAPHRVSTEAGPSGVVFARID